MAHTSVWTTKNDRSRLRCAGAALLDIWRIAEYTLKINFYPSFDVYMSSVSVPVAQEGGGGELDYTAAIHQGVIWLQFKKPSCCWSLSTVYGSLYTNAANVERKINTRSWCSNEEEVCHLSHPRWYAKTDTGHISEGAPFSIPYIINNQLIAVTHFASSVTSTVHSTDYTSHKF